MKKNFEDMTYDEKQSRVRATMIVLSLIICIMITWIVVQDRHREAPSSSLSVSIEFVEEYPENRAKLLEFMEDDFFSWYERDEMFRLREVARNKKWARENEAKLNEWRQE